MIKKNNSNSSFSDRVLAALRSANSLNSFGNVFPFLAQEVNLVVQCDKQQAWKDWKKTHHLFNREATN